MPKFITVTPNPAIDRTYSLTKFESHEVNRADNVVQTAGGKGINVARALRTLGSSSISTGFVGGLVGKQFQELLNKERLKHDFVDISPEKTRLAILISDKSVSKQTVVNEAGPNVTSKSLALLQDKIISLSSGYDGVVFSGSIPMGISAKNYKDLIFSVKSKFKLSLLDATGDVLNTCIEAKPSILKINRNEALTLGVNIREWNSGAIPAANHIRNEFGLDYVALTDGGHGAVLVSEQGHAKAHMPKITVNSAVGSGDSFAAGLIHALVSTPTDIAGALRLASACGAANALTSSPADFDSDQIVALSGRIKVG
jgi:1-phosphofructokinase family hexose kinase